MKKKRKSTRTKNLSGKGWASFRVRGIKTSLKNLYIHPELSAGIQFALHEALYHVEDAVKILDEEKKE